MATAATASDLISAGLFSAALATTALGVSATSGRAGTALVIVGPAVSEAAADASFIEPALTWTVLTLTGFIGSAEPGIAQNARGWVTPLVRGAGWGLACGSPL